MPIFNLNVYRREAAQWGAAERYTLESTSLQGAVSKLARKLGMNFKHGLSKDAKTCWSLDSPPELSTFYLEIYVKDGESLDFKNVQRDQAVALDEFDAARQLRLKTGRRFRHTAFDESLQANRFECKDYALFVHYTNPLGEDSAT